MPLFLPHDSCTTACAYIATRDILETADKKLWEKYHDDDDLTPSMTPYKEVLERMGRQTGSGNRSRKRAKTVNDKNNRSAWKVGQGVITNDTNNKPNNNTSNDDTHTTLRLRGGRGDDVSHPNLVNHFHISRPEGDVSTRHKVLKRKVTRELRNMYESHGTINKKQEFLLLQASCVLDWITIHRGACPRSWSKKDRRRV